MKFSDWVSLLSLVIALGSAAFSIYQWHDAERDTQIRTAIEISRNFLEHRTKEDEVALASMLSDRNYSTDKLISFYKKVDEFEYIAYLTNHGRIDRDFVSRDVKCEIYLTRIALRTVNLKVPQMLAVDHPEIEKFQDDPSCKKVFDPILGIK